MINSISVNCEYPKTIVNRRYSKYGNENQRLFRSYPDYYINVPCGRCVLCKSRIAKEWKVRLSYECETTRTHLHQGKQVPRVVFLTFTISDQYYTDDDNFFVPWFVKFRDSWRKAYGKSPRYWCITDRGSQFGRLHLHMLLFDPRKYDRKRKEYTEDISINELKTKHGFWWHYGFVDAQWVKSMAVSNYVVNYITGANMYNEEPVKHGKPICEKALSYKPKIFVSKGLGANRVDASFARYVASRDYATISMYGFVYALPRYLFNKVTDYWCDPSRIITPTDSVRVINPLRDEIIWQRQALNKAQELDYYYRTGFDESNMRYRYRAKDLDFSVLTNIIQTNKRLLTSADKPLADVTLIENERLPFVQPLSLRISPDLPYEGLHRGYFGEEQRWLGYEDFPY